MTLSEFVKKYTGVKNVGNTADNKGQCVGLAMVWVETLELKHFWGHAKDLFNNAPADEWIKIENAPDKYPIGGDVIIWKGTYPGSGGYGHIALVLWSNKEEDSFTVLEQNNPGAEVGLQCEITTYKDWTHVKGWIRPKKDIPTDDSTDNTYWKSEYEKFKMEIDAEREKHAEEVRTKNQTIIEYEQLNSRLTQEAFKHTEDMKVIKKEKSTLTEACSALEAQVKNLKLENAQKIEDLDKRIKKLTDSIAPLKKELKQVSWWTFIKVKFGR